MYPPPISHPTSLLALQVDEATRRGDAALAELASVLCSTVEVKKAREGWQTSVTTQPSSHRSGSLDILLYPRVFEKTRNVMQVRAQAVDGAAVDLTKPASIARVMRSLLPVLAGMPRATLWLGKSAGGEAKSAGAIVARTIEASGPLGPLTAPGTFKSAGGITPFSGSRGDVLAPKADTPALTRGCLVLGIDVEVRADVGARCKLSHPPH